MRPPVQICADLEREIRAYRKQEALALIAELRATGVDARTEEVLVDLVDAVNRNDRRTSLLLLDMVRGILKGDL